MHCGVQGSWQNLVGNRTLRIRHGGSSGEATHWRFGAWTIILRGMLQLQVCRAAEEQAKPQWSYFATKRELVTADEPGLHPPSYPFP